MALAQNLLELATDYSFCGINRVFACQNRAKLRLKDRFLQEVALQSRKPDNSGYCGRVYRKSALPSLKKRRHIQFHHANQAAWVVWSTVIVEASIRDLIPEMNFLSRLVHIINEEKQITV